MANRPPLSRWCSRLAVLAVPALLLTTLGLTVATPAGATTTYPSTTAASVNPTTTEYGASVSYSLTVTSPDGTPQGSAFFEIGGTQLCEVSTLTNGSGACASAAAPAGTSVVTAVYVGNQLNAQDQAFANSSGTTSLTVNVPPPAPPYGASGSTTGAGTNQTGDFVVHQGNLTVQANGAGSVTLSNFSANPTNVAVAGSTSAYDNVALGNGSNFSTVLVGLCNPGAASSLQWFNGTSWTEFSSQSTSSGCLFALVGPKSSPTLSQFADTPIAATYLAPPDAVQGYWMTASDGGVFSFNRPFFGSTGGIHLNQPIVGMAATHDNGGYWLAASDGGVFSFGDAHFFGSLPYEDQRTSKVVSIVADPATGGYLLIKSDGTVWDFHTPSFGDLPYFGIHVNNIVGGAMTPDGLGLYLVSAAGKVYDLLGDGSFQGDTSGLTLNAPIISMSVDPVTSGYWLLGKDGGVFSFNAPFFGSTGNLTLNQPVVGMTPTRDGGGYWFVASDGGIFSFGDATFYGSTGNIRLNRPVVGMAGG